MIAYNLSIPPSMPSGKEEDFEDLFDLDPASCYAHGAGGAEVTGAAALSENRIACAEIETGRLLLFR